MPLLADISLPRSFNAQPCFHLNHNQISSSGNSLILPKRAFFIRAVATLVVPHANAAVSMGERPGFMASAAAPSTSDADSDEMDERERLRRHRISKANKGNTPWNKGRKHSAETLRRIKERTRLAMQDPKVKMKLIKLGHAQSKETRMKIGAGVRMGWQRRREKLVLQETCHFDWQNLIAEASRQGYKGEEELQWDSYQILNEELKKEWLESVEQRKKMPRPVGSRRAPKSAEQRKKISESISAKWADPEYRDRVCSALAKYHGTPIGVNRRPRRKHSESTESTRSTQKKEKSDVSPAGGSRIESQRLRLRKSKAPRFKDPLASSKLEMIKSIRAQRAVAETQKTEAIERARLLIAEAEKAAKALEVAATRSPIARASLLETRKLIAEAIQSIESIDIEPTESPQTEEQNAAASYSYELDSPNDEGDFLAGKEDQNGAVQTIANGTQLFPSSIDKDFDFSKFSLQDLLGVEKKAPASSNGYGVSDPSFSSVTTNYPNGNGSKPSEHKPSMNGTKVHHLEEKADSKVITVTKKWVRGRLVEVAEGA